MRKYSTLAVTLFAALVVSHAQAAEVHFDTIATNNYEGGQIMVTEYACQNGKDGLEVISTNRFGRIVDTGCVTVSTKNFFSVSWQDGDVQVYSKADFVRTTGRYW